MPRYFFNIHHDEGVDVHDDIGAPLETRAELYKRMMSMALDLVDGMRPDDQPWLVEALDESGMIVCTMDLAIQVERLRRPVASGSIPALSSGGSRPIRSR